MARLSQGVLFSDRQILFSISIGTTLLRIIRQRSPGTWYATSRKAASRGSQFIPRLIDGCARSQRLSGAAVGDLRVCLVVIRAEFSGMRLAPCNRSRGQPLVPRFLILDWLATEPNVFAVYPNPAHPRNKPLFSAFLRSLAQPLVF